MAFIENKRFNPIDHPIIFSKPKRLLNSSAWIQHIPFAFFLIEILQPKIFVELGTHSGVSFCAFCQAIKALQLDTKAFAIDTWEGDVQTGYYGKEIYQDLLDFNTKHFSNISTLLRSTFDNSVHKFEDGSIDLLHIDGCHNYESVKHDFETWKPKLSERAVVIFHDTNVLEGEFGVWKLWKELSPTYPSYEFRHGNGLGILTVGEKAPRVFIDFINTAKNHSGISTLFNILGERLENTQGDSKKEQEIGRLEETIVLNNISLYKKEIQIDEIYNSETWKIGTLIGKPFRRVFPIGSIQRNFVSKIKGVFTNKTAKKNKYYKWINNNEPTDKELEKQRIISSSFAYQPLISIIIPVYNTPIHILKEALNSVIIQTYPRWQICIANGSPDNQEINAVLESYKTNHENKILYKNLDGNEGIAGNTNAAIAMATGEFVGFLDHDDTLAPFALYAIVNAINEEPSADLLYSDEDKISADSKNRNNPFFKPAFSPDYLRAINYICHLVVVRKTLGDKLGWIRHGFEGAQDFDLVLRVTEKARSIVHIPQILYHWRTIKGSTAQSIDAKGYATESGIKAVKEHLQRNKLAGQVIEGPVPTSYRVVLEITQKPLISIIIPNCDHTNDLLQCVESIINISTYSNYEIIIVENNSTDQSTFNLYSELDKDKKISILFNNDPFNYSRINNLAAKHAKGQVLLFLNNDTEVISSTWIEEMLQHALRPEIGFVGAKLYYPDNTIQHAGVSIGYDGIPWHLYLHEPRESFGYGLSLQAVRNVTALTGACFMIRKEVFDKIGGFDEIFVLAFGDVDICLKSIQNGYLNIWTPFAELYHFESKTRGYEDTYQKKDRLANEIQLLRHKWFGNPIFIDPYYNPNLIIGGNSYSINDLSIWKTQSDRLNRISTDLLGS
jgi:GT2 family glycosyltransferase